MEPCGFPTQITGSYMRTRAQRVRQCYYVSSSDSVPTSFLPRPRDPEAPFDATSALESDMWQEMRTERNDS